MIGYYLSSAEVWDGDREPVARAVRESLGAFAGPVLAIHRVRQSKPLAVLRPARV